MGKKDTLEGTSKPEASAGAGDNPASPNGEMAPGYGATPSADDNAPAPVGSISDMVATVSESHEGFDPALHAVNPDGTPKRKVDGSYALKRGRKAGQSAPAAGPAVATAEVTINTDEAARQSCNMLINGAVLLLGDQWEPRDKDEAKGLQISFKNYFDARGVPNVPPEVGLAVAVLAYSLPRITHEKTVSRFATIKIRCFEIWRAMRGK